MPRMFVAACAVATALSIHSTAVGAAEPWADDRLGVRDGLQLWLDASRAGGDQPVVTGSPLAKWADASGRGRHLSQPAENSRPTVLKVGNAAIVRFDGLDDHLRAVKQNAELRAWTVFVMAAPRQNLGGFPGLLAFNARDQRDYTSGLTLDLGPWPSPSFSTLNVEGRGFGGARSLRTSESPLQRLTLLEVVADVSGPVRLSVDGQPEGERPRDAFPVSLEEITVGARYYNNGPGPQRVESYGRSDIAEVLVYDRVLTPDEAKSVRDYLRGKYEAIKDSLPRDDDGRSEPLVTVKDPPAVQMFLPGFSVRRLPVELTNINNVKYRPDGTLVALAYDGKVHLLRDTDGDGLEDTSTLFWDNPNGQRSTIGMDLTPPGYEHGDGLFVVGKSKLALIVDTDRDGKADREIDVVGGWKESFHQVDGLGVAFDPRDGSVYFGRGSYNFTDPLLRDKEGVAHYSLSDEGSAILRVSPDLKSREIVVTGIRFPVGLRINRHGDLFATDQEGATWVPNGNPFDELLHIQKGRHYGFPARHPKHLPNVIDEPSTFDYGPQHQSTCGLNFNEPVRPDAPVFGPVAWTGDAIVTGYSRGKLYRTQLVKTEPGYVARTQLLACLNMLTVDACVGPDGSLVVACHSGGPDWGSGPSGKGQLFQIRYSDRDHPQPAVVWPSGPRELRVEFDRPVAPELLHDVLAQTKLTAGTAVRAGDRFESLWPGYAIVQAQKLAPRYPVGVHSAQLTPDRRTLVLATDPSLDAVSYALTLPGMGRPAADAIKSPELPQYAAIDLDFDLTGCEATWTPADGGAGWTGWLPHLDLQVARAMTAGSASHDRLWEAMERPGALTLRCQLDLTDMLRPAVQPGSQLDYEYPPETVTVRFESAAGLHLLVKSAVGETTAVGPAVTFTRAPRQNEPVAVELRLTHRGGMAALVPSWTTNEDGRPRPFPLRRLLVPWADTTGKAREQLADAPIPELEGGSWARGRKVFFGEQAACFKCHTIHRQGGAIGPDLSNLAHRDYASVLRDITTPSFAINPDHLTYVVVLNDGRSLTGVIHNEGDKVRIGDLKGVVTEVAKSDIDEMHPSPISTMPEGLPKQLGPDRLRDLMTFLLRPAPQMPRDLALHRPKPRTLPEVTAVLAGAPQPPEPMRPLRIVLVAGPKDHGPGEHDYPAWQKAWAELLAAANDVDVVTAWEWPEKAEFQRADAMVFYQHGDWNAERAADIDAFLDRGGGLTYIHWAIDGRQQGREFAQRIGLSALGGVAFRHGELTMQFRTAIRHPIIRNFDRLALTDETYWKMVGDLPDDRVLGTAVEEGQPQPQLWTAEPRNGRVFVSIPGHYSWTFDDPLFRVLLLRGIAWTAREPVDRFNDLVWPGADVAR
uniref:Cytochrome c domain-containing protein n=1 Tax=Schlesneria paludicola TaxID=360056 RepID=A0A7C2JY32_9PLAN